MASAAQKVADEMAKIEGNAGSAAVKDGKAPVAETKKRAPQLPVAPDANPVPPVREVKGIILIEFPTFRMAIPRPKFDMLVENSRLGASNGYRIVINGNGYPIPDYAAKALLDFFADAEPPED